MLEIKQTIYLINKLQDIINFFIFPENLSEDDEECENESEKKKEFGFKN